MEPDKLEMEPHAGDEWGAQMAIPGYIAAPGEDEYRHRVGGDSWKVVDPKSPSVPPVLLLTLDLGDPRLASLQMEGVNDLPLAFHVNCEWPMRQEFRIEPETRTVRRRYPDITELDRRALRHSYRDFGPPKPLAEFLRVPEVLSKGVDDMRRQAAYPFLR